MLRNAQGDIRVLDTQLLPNKISGPLARPDMGDEAEGPRGGMKRIGIVGAGLSGRLVALNLLRSASPKRRVSILMFDRGDERYMGPAYSGESDCLLLNVPAGRLGAFSSDPEHFVKWLERRGTPVGEWDFLPRLLYREYVLALLHEAVEKQAQAAKLEHVRGEVIDLASEQEDGVTLHVSGRAPFSVDKAVLALGNFPPRHPEIQTSRSLRSERYVHNPWSRGALDDLSEHDTVLLIGTGQTTVDLVSMLHRRGHLGQLVAISRKGWLPLAHRGFASYPSFFHEIRDSRSVLEICRVVRKHLETTGIDRRSVIDSLRPHTQTIWRSLPEQEKRRFVRHLFRSWEIIRSRIPPESESLIDALRASGQLRILAGRIYDLVETESGMEIHFIRRGSQTPGVELAARVINCIGPESDYRKIDDPLVKNLLRRGLVRPGPAQIGIDALPHNGAIVGERGTISKELFTLGSTMKGVLWEVLAVQEIRAQAEKLAQVLLGKKPQEHAAS
jgi:uncharacterized NAD(P)/FAD-binding protein YdhS